MGICGLNEFIAYCLKHPTKSRYQLACQGSELMIGLGKLYCSELGTGKWDMPEKLANYYDLSGVIKLKNNQVDIGRLIEQLSKEKLLIYNENTTPKLERELENDSCLLFDYMVKLLDNWEVGQPIPPFLNQIQQCVTLTPNAWSIDKIKDICSNTMHVLKQDLQVGSDEYMEILKKIEELHDKQDKRKNLKNSLKMSKVVVQNRV